MPRHTNPRSRAKHDRGYAREQRDRVIAKRLAQYRRISVDEWMLRNASPAKRAAGRLANDQAWWGCGRSRCGLCHPHKRFPQADRQRAAEAWRRMVDVAY